MGFPPHVINKMTLWEFACCVEGFKEANGVESDAPAISDDWLAELGIVGFSKTVDI